LSDLPFVYLCSDLSAAESVFVCCSSSTSVRISLLLNLYLPAALRLSLFGSLCCCVSALHLFDFRSFLVKLSM
ncbi:hypothetical protein Tco_0447247, partial [Tanacetum coccineum]